MSPVAVAIQVREIELVTPVLGTSETLTSGLVLPDAVVGDMVVGEAVTPPPPPPPPPPVGGAVGAVGDVVGDALGIALGDALGEAVGDALGALVVGELVGDDVGGGQSSASTIRTALADASARIASVRHMIGASAATVRRYTSPLGSVTLAGSMPGSGGRS